VSEAEKYDKSLVESWKSDMEGMLIFVRVLWQKWDQHLMILNGGSLLRQSYSFIIESYKTLIPDSGDSTMRLLAQISQQLAAAANGTTFQGPLAPHTHFSPPTSSLVCNALWFISLGLSLTCALIATLLEQWARDFLHKTSMRSAPFIRARIFSYLYYGMKRFNMHTVVDVIPLLLHASLLFFFAGLVAFLIPINLPIAAVAAALLAILMAVYSLLTVLPLWFLDCPYHTPLSAAFWRISQSPMPIWCKPADTADGPDSPPSETTMVEAMSQQAMKVSPECMDRDYRALVWAVKSLADDTELEPFVEAISDVLWGPKDRLHAYNTHIQNLIRDPHLELKSRIYNLFHSCGSGLLSPEAANR
jgi:hypothetical protein